MAIPRHTQTAVGTSATVIEGTQHQGWILQNLGTDVVYLGDATVTTGTGFPIQPGGVFSPPEVVHLRFGGELTDRLYGIAASSQDVRVLAWSRGRS